jgi:glutamyl-tRNA synthetase
MAIENIEQKMLAYALKNAVEHEGKCQSGAVLNPLFHEGLDKSEVKNVMPQINEIVKKVNSMSLDEQKIELEEAEKLISHRKERVGMPELEDVSATGIITRFSPSSSASAFHIGHILTGMPACLYVKKYGGKLYLRIEDTNPEKTVPECYETFPKEAEWIFGNITEHYAQSDRMPKYYKFAQELVDKGFAFVCTCIKENAEETTESNIPKIREPCKCRNNSIKDNQEKWEEMLDERGFKEGEAVLRFKTSLDQKNPALVDFPLARINLTPHPHVGNKYRVWPLMNLCVTYDDMEQKCTHIIRAKEHADNALRQAMIFEALKIPLPHTYFLGRYKFTDLEISKTKITERIKKGEFKGWEDIRLPLARNFKKRGYQPEAFARMVEQRGLSKVDKVMDQKDLFTVLNNFNREIIKPMSTEIEFSKKKSKETPNEYILLMDDASESKVYTQVKLENEKIYFLKDIGYAKLNSNTLWFCHN